MKIKWKIMKFASSKMTGCVGKKGKQEHCYKKCNMYKGKESHMHIQKFILLKVYYSYFPELAVLCFSLNK